MTQRELVDLMSLVLGLVMIVVVVVSWQFLGMAVKERPMLARIYRMLSVIWMVLILSAAIVFFIAGPGLSFITDML